VLTTRLEDPTGYGRIFRGKKGQLVRIVEQKDLLAGEEKVREINTGIYCVEARFLFKALAGLSDQNAQKEYYLTDIVAQASSRGEKACAYLAEDSVEVMGINTRLDLAKASQYLRHKIAERHMLEGVTLMDPQTTYIDPGVEIGRDTVLYPNCYLAGKTSLGEKCLVESGCKITDTQVGNSVTIRSSSVITESIVEDRVEVGPFAHLRPQTLLRQGLRIGHGAGSTITKDVPAGCLAVSKVRQAHYKKRFQRKG
jgi:bifunctional UDP-N-acetylglucosamine pyrophosphorylase/glucosamine-1-phosphate N-acetyltransferase